MHPIRRIRRIDCPKLGSANFGLVNPSEASDFRSDSLNRKEFCLKNKKIELTSWARARQGFDNVDILFVPPPLSGLFFENFICSFLGSSCYQKHSIVFPTFLFFSKMSDSDR